MEILVVLAVAVFAVIVIAAPLLRGRAGDPGAARAAELADLEAAKEAKLREIRDAALDRRLGKLAAEDWKALDASLRQDAIGLMREIDELEAKTEPDRNTRG